MLLRPDPTAPDPWFLAGFPRGTANNRQAGSYASTATRLDVRRLQLPRSRWTNNAATARAFAHSTSSSGSSGTPGGSTRNSCAACTTA
ncbi:putative type II restriction-modification system DNA adenine-specific methylase [Streptomyces viridochromogenes Tue57]|uniref:Putative type II restriction-modification system DNA adenine-specific methylase n=1 Tax=Streptomyces viridochromogenes Tue57 TaxID=1160705 RepID=L8PBR9_STRVR|nr:putative type II restriction-modification system DNA adenine-specific methylase [Streptomyces viridochromogenes Tue57]